FYQINEMTKARSWWTALGRALRRANGLRKRSLKHGLEFFVRQKALGLERMFLDGHHHLHGFLFGELNAHLLKPHFDRIDAAALADDDLGGGLAHHVPMEREQLGRIVLAAVHPPTGDDAGFDLEQLVADHGTV